MATTIKLLDLPQEIIVIILREHFVGLSVNVKAPGSIFGQARQPGYNESVKSSQHWLGIGLSTKRLYPTAQTVFLEQATFHCNSVNNNNLQNEYIAVRQLQLVRHLATNLSVLSRIDNPEVLELVFPKIQDILVKGTLKVLVFSDRVYHMTDLPDDHVARKVLFARGIRTVNRLVVTLQEASEFSYGPEPATFGELKLVFDEQGRATLREMRNVDVT